MSASLVGSEMCIRDSASSEVCPVAWPLQACPVARWGSPCHQSPLVPPPVSYTHLTLPTICSV
eukprot:6289815-Alexandrium_andersonii.AAC.1